MIGAYGEWAAQSMPDPPRLSFRQPMFGNVEAWRPVARARFREMLLGPGGAATPVPAVQHQLEFDGLSIEHLQWQLPYGPPTEALVLKPAGAQGSCPALWRCMTMAETSTSACERSRECRRIRTPRCCGTRSNTTGEWLGRTNWHGAGTWCWCTTHSRSEAGACVWRICPAISATIWWRPIRKPRTRSSATTSSPAAHEHLIAKSLFSAGMTWPGVFVFDDQRAVDYLASRPDVDATRIGCGGLSGGGLRTVMLTGADERIRCSCCVGMMTTWRDYLLNKCYTHTWMCYVPGLPRDLDYPEVLGLGAPNPVLVLNNRQDALFTMPEMERADRILTEVYKKAGKPGALPGEILRRAAQVRPGHAERSLRLVRPLAEGLTLSTHA